LSSVFRIINSEVIAGLRQLPDKSIHCAVTSPPYWGLRDYGTAKWEGGNADCDHSNVRRDPSDEKQATQKGSSRDKVGRECRHCGALRIDSQIGLEPTPDAYVARQVEVFREVRRVLRNDGTLWLNLGDSYARPAEKGQRGPSPKQDSNNGTPQAIMTDVPPGLKSKDLVGIPWRVAFALQADGWYLRSDIIWAKPNPMPESVTDRPTKSHEYVFLLTKSERYFYDAEAIAEPTAYPGDGRHLRGDLRKEVDPKCKDNGSRTRTGNPTGENRNRRTVWTIATSPFAEAHFATFPPALVRLCVRAGCPQGGTVLDPFCGSGTTGVVALRQGRKFVGIDLSTPYCAMARKRILRSAPLFNTEADLAAVLKKEKPVRSLI
jgi:DNA modification methylase